MLENFLNISEIADHLTWSSVLFSMALSLALSLLVAVVYKNTHKGLSYSQSFTFTLAMIGFLISTVMMVIGNSLTIAFGAFGAFSLIRFRTAIKDSRDIAFILLVVAIGLAVGTGNYMIAIITTLISIIAIYTLNKINFGSIKRYDYILTFAAESENFSNEKFREVLKDYLKYDNLLNVTSKESGRILDYSFSIKFVNSNDMEKFISKLNQIEGVKDVDIISTKNDIEY